MLIARQRDVDLHDERQACAPVQVQRRGEHDRSQHRGRGAHGISVRRQPRVPSSATPRLTAWMRSISHTDKKVVISRWVETGWRSNDRTRTPATARSAGVLENFTEGSMTCGSIPNWSCWPTPPFRRPRRAVDGAPRSDPSDAQFSPRHAGVRAGRTGGSRLDSRAAASRSAA